VRRLLLAPVLLFLLAATCGAGTDLAVTTVTYASPGGVNLLADIGTSGGSGRPVVIIIHGGGWARGSRLDFRHDVERLTYPEFGGFVTMAIDYRLACDPLTYPKKKLCGYHHPAQSEDVQAAVDWARANISGYGGDPNRITILGFSAGAHLAYMQATTGSGVDAVAGLSGPTTLDERCTEYLCPIFTNYVGCSFATCPEAWANASPITHVTTGTIPNYVYNTYNEVIPRWHAEEYAQALTGAGVANQLRIWRANCHAKTCEDRVLEHGKTVLWEATQFLLAHSA
jgi:acetyl esterase/lipase